MLYLKYSVVWVDLYWPRWGAEVMKTERSCVWNISLLIRSRHGWQKFITPTSRRTHVGASYGSDYPLHKLLLKLRSSLLHFKDGVFLNYKKKKIWISCCLFTCLIFSCHCLASAPLFRALSEAVSGGSAFVFPPLQAEICPWSSFILMGHRVKGRRL